MVSNILPNEVELFDRIAKEWIDDYKYWKMCYYYCKDETILTSEGNQKLISSVLLKMSTPSKLRTYEILALILYQIETDTFCEKLPMIYHLLSSLVEFSLPTMSTLQYRDLKHYVMQFALEHPPLILGNIKKANNEKLEAMKKVSEILLDKDEVKNVMNLITGRQNITKFEEIKPNDHYPLLSDVEEESQPSIAMLEPVNGHISVEPEITSVVDKNLTVVPSEIQKENKKNVKSGSTASDSSFSTASTNFKKPEVPKPLKNCANKVNTGKPKTRQLYTACKDLVEFTPASSLRNVKEPPTKKRILEMPKRNAKQKCWELDSSSSVNDPYDLTNYNSKSSTTSRLSPRRRGHLAVEPRKRMPWSLEEEDALVMGVEKYGKGNWKEVKHNKVLNERTVRDCYDKWKNIIKYNHLPNIKARIKRKAKS